VIDGLAGGRGDCARSEEVFYDNAMTRRRMSMACRIGGSRRSNPVRFRHFARTTARFWGGARRSHDGVGASIGYRQPNGRGI